MEIKNRLQDELSLELGKNVLVYTIAERRFRNLTDISGHADLLTLAEPGTPDNENNLKEPSVLVAVLWSAGKSMKTVSTRVTEVINTVFYGKDVRMLKGYSNDNY